VAKTLKNPSSGVRKTKTSSARENSPFPISSKRRGSLARDT
jgi:hypothetical protein